MMGYLLLGFLLAGLLLVLLNWWAAADVKSAKRSLTWAIVAVSLVLGLILLATGKAVLAVVPAGFALFRMVGPTLAKLAIGHWIQGRFGKASSRPPQQTTEQMSRAEALEVLGLREGASQQEIKDAYRRLMSQMHPDKGGSDWMAAKLNSAKRILLD